MVFHRANPANFEAPGGTDYDPLWFDAAHLRADLAELAHQHCLGHGVAIIDALLARYHITPRDPQPHRPCPVVPPPGG